MSITRAQLPRSRGSVGSKAIKKVNGTINMRIIIHLNAKQNFIGLIDNSLTMLFGKFPSHNCSAL